MKGQQAAALCLQAFEEFSQSLEDEKQSGKAKPKSEPKQEAPKLGGSMKARPNIGGPAPKRKGKTALMISRRNPAITTNPGGSGEDRSD
jgi:hypothetical protein